MRRDVLGITEAYVVDALRLGGLPVGDGGPKHVDSRQPDLKHPTPSGSAHRTTFGQEAWPMRHPTITPRRLQEAGLRR
jgi:hypothetical protein